MSFDNTRLYKTIISISNIYDDIMLIDNTLP